MSASTDPLPGRTPKLYLDLAAWPQAFRRYHEEPSTWIIPIRDCELMAEYGWIKPRRTTLPELAQEYLDILVELY